MTNAPASGTRAVDTSSGPAPRSVSGRERALHYLRSEVLTDPDRQGTFVNEQAVASAVGVSRTPVREALLILASDGMVQMLPQRGAYIPAMTAREIRELFELRGVLERHAGNKIIEARAEPAGELESIIAEQQRIAARDDHRLAAAREFIDADRRFHQAMVDAAGSTLLSSTYAALRDRQLRTGIAAMQKRGSRWQEVCTEHRAITDALSAGDRHRLFTAIDDHLAITLGTLLAV